MDDFMLPNDGSFYDVHAEPEEQVTERRASQAKAQAAKPMLEDLIALFESDIQQLKSIESIPEAVMLDTEEFRIAWTMNQRLLEYAKGKKAHLESLLLTVQR